MDWLCNSCPSKGKPVGQTKLYRMHFYKNHFGLVLIKTLLTKTYLIFVAEFLIDLVPTDHNLLRQLLLPTMFGLIASLQVIQLVVSVSSFKYL